MPSRTARLSEKGCGFATPECRAQRDVAVHPRPAPPPPLLAAPRLSTTALGDLEIRWVVSRVHAEAAGFVFTAVHAAGDANRLGALALKGELGGVLDNQDGAVRRGEAVARGLEMAGQDLRLADPIIGEEAVGRLRVRPVLACERQARP